MCVCEEGAGTTEKACGVMPVLTGTETRWSREHHLCQMSQSIFLPPFPILGKLHPLVATLLRDTEKDLGITQALVSLPFSNRSPIGIRILLVSDLYPVHLSFLKEQGYYS